MSEPVEPRIAFIGCVGEGRRSLETLLDIQAHVVGVFTLRPDLAAAVSGAVPWEDLTCARGLPLYYVRNINDPEPVSILRALSPDLVFCVGWTQLLRREILDLPRLGCVGFHASLLPRYRGRAPVNWAIIHGEQETGNTMMQLDEGVDTGDILAQRRFPIEQHDTCASIYERVARSEDEMIREVLPLIRGGRLPRRSQDHALATVMPRRRPEDGLVDWHRTTQQLHDWVRAMTHPYPGAFTQVRGERLLVWSARPWRPGPGGPSPSSRGTGWLRLEGTRLLCGTLDGDLELLRVQVAGGPELDGSTFARGQLPAAGLDVAGGAP